MSKWAALLIVFCLSAPVCGEDRPLKTEDPAPLSIGVIRADFGVEFLHRQRYSLSGLEGDLMRFGVTNIRIGAGEYAEFQISGVFRDFLTVSRRNLPVLPYSFVGDTSSDFGDLILGTKLKLATEKGARPAIAFKFAVQLPNATNESGLGTDETEFYASTLLSKHLGRAQLLGNVGLAVLGSPVQPNSQADLLTYGFGIVMPVRNSLELVGQVYGRQGPARIGNESLAQVQAGTRFRAAGLRWDISGLAGLEHFSPSSGLIVGVTYEFQAFHKKRSPTTIRPGKLPNTIPTHER